MAERWTKTSALPSDGAMKPNPLSALNHLTVPCAILAFLPGGAPLWQRGGPPRCFPAGSAVYRVDIPYKRVLRPGLRLSQIAVQLTFLGAYREKLRGVGVRAATMRPNQPPHALLPRRVRYPLRP